MSGIKSIIKHDNIMDADDQEASLVEQEGTFVYGILMNICLMIVSSDPVCKTGSTSIKRG
jgi:hypothetical protein